MIVLTYNQLIKIGVHLGHSFLNSKFFSSWMLYGWRDTRFIFDTVYSIYSLRMGLLFVRKSVLKFRPIWFVNLNPYLSPIVARYTYSCGESFSIYRWVNGTLTNFRSVTGWGTLLYRLASENKYNFTHHDRKDLSSLIGFIFNRRRLPGALFLPSVKNCEIVSDEFSAANIATIGVVDSNALSWTVTIPIAGNDDSYQCINFYCFLFSKQIMVAKLAFMKYWHILYMLKRRYYKKRYYIMYLFNKFKFNISNFEENHNIMLNILKNTRFFWKRPLTQHEALFKSFVKDDVIFRWKDY